MYDLLVKIRGFKAVKRLVVNTPTARVTASSQADASDVVAAVDKACLLYVKPTLCLQRATVVTRLLRKRGVGANLVIGCRMPPLKAHAWVEVDGQVISEDQPGLHFFQVLDRW